MGAVQTELQRRHGREPHWQAAEHQSDRMRRLLEAGEVLGTLLVLAPI